MTLRIFLLVALGTLIGGCATQVDPPSPAPASTATYLPAATLPNGIWTGDVTRSLPDTGVGAGNGSRVEYTVFTHCDGIASVIHLNDEGQLVRSDARRTFVSYHGVHILFEFNKFGGDTPGWVETAQWTLVDIDGRQLDIRQGRSISNQGVALDDPLRSIGATAYGRLVKRSDECRKD